MNVGEATFGPYRLEAKLGEGGMGSVYRAFDPQAGREVALKVVRNGQPSVRALKRFRREGELTARLDHPGIVRVHSAGEFEGIPYLAYELIEGARELQDVFKVLGQEERVRLVHDAAAALGFAHAQGVLHRDVKTANLLVGRDGVLKVADFGLALAQEGDRLTQTGALVGTLCCMAPEQFRGKEGELSPATDVWALGVVLYEALTGQLPFMAPSFAELMPQIVNGKYRLPSELAPVPPALEAVCKRALAASPAARYADGAAMAAALQDALAQGTAGRFARRVRRHRLPLLGAVILGLVASAALAIPQGGAERTASSGSAQIAEPARGRAVLAEERAEGELAFGALRELDPEDLGAEAEAWLSRYDARHPRRRQVEQMLQGVLRSHALRSFASHRKGACFVGDDRVLVAGGGRWSLFDLTSGRRLWEQEATIGNPVAAATAAGGRFAFANDRRVTIASASGDQRVEAQAPETVLAMAFSPDGEILALGGRFARVLLLDARSGEQRAALPNVFDVRSLAFSPDGSLLAAGQDDEEKTPAWVNTWRVPAGDPLVRVNVGKCASGLAFVGGSQLAVCTRGGQVMLLSLPGGEKATTLTGRFDGRNLDMWRSAHTSAVNGIAVSRGQLFSVSGGSSDGMGIANDVAVWDTSGWHQLGRYLTRRDGYAKLEISPNGERVLLCLDSGVTEVWHRDAFR